MTEIDRLKKEAAIRAADHVDSGMVVGLGTGSTVRYLLEEIGARLASGALRDVRGVPTSSATERVATELGIPLVELDRHPRLDVAIDGADEVDAELRAIKGLGGALLREKIVATAADRFVVIIDSAKRVQKLGTRSPLPVEVDRFAVGWQLAAMRELGAEAQIRVGPMGERVLTDGGHYLIDCRFPGGIDEPEALDAVLHTRPGIVETGLFLGLVTHLVTATQGGVEEITAPDQARS